MNKNYRLRRNRDFQYVINKGKSAKNSSFFLFFKANSLKFNRYGVAVSSKKKHL